MHATERRICSTATFLWCPLHIPVKVRNANFPRKVFTDINSPRVLDALIFRRNASCPSCQNIDAFLLRKRTSVFRGKSGQGKESYCRNFSIARPSVFPFPLNWRGPGVDRKEPMEWWRATLLWRFPSRVPARDSLHHCCLGCCCRYMTEIRYSCGRRAAATHAHARLRARDGRLLRDHQARCGSLARAFNIKEIELDDSRRFTQPYRRMRISAQYCLRSNHPTALERHNFQCACTPMRTPGRTATRSRCSGRRRSASRRRATATPPSGATRSARGQGRPEGAGLEGLIRVNPQQLGHFLNLIHLTKHTEKTPRIPTAGF